MLFKEDMYCCCSRRTCTVVVLRGPVLLLFQEDMYCCCSNRTCTVVVPGGPVQRVCGDRPPCALADHRRSWPRCSKDHGGLQRGPAFSGT